MSKRLDDLDYYTLLGLDRDAGHDAIRRAFHAFALKYHPDNHTHDQERHRRATAIFRRGTEAYRVLLDPDRRAVYDEGLARGELRLRAGAERRKSHRTAKPLGPRARGFFAAAERARQAGDRKTALLNLKIALQHEPDSFILQARIAELE